MGLLKTSLYLVLGLMAVGASAAELGLSTAGALYAPPDVKKSMGQDPNVSLSMDQRKDLIGEFRGLVYLALGKASYDQWEGKSMADCLSADNQGVSVPEGERWRYQCEIITGEGNGFYYFYPTTSRRAYTLQKVDIQLDVSDPRLVDDLHLTLQTLFGRGRRVKEHARHWETAEDVADLYIDKPRTHPEGIVRFVWSRAPLISTRQARAY